jgi:hypothetical protein
VAHSIIGNTNIKTRVLLGIVFILVISVFVSIFIGTRCWLSSLPSWQLSVERKDSGSIITISMTKSEGPIYKVIINGWRVSQPFNRLLLRETIPMREVETTFVDDDVPPGRWTLTVGGIKLDIMPARLIVNNSLVCKPGETLLIETEQGKKREKEKG